jgi:hypothetical protein
MRIETLKQSIATYAGYGWQCVPVKARGKTPDMPAGWQNSKLTVAELVARITGESNLGIILGGPSNGLVDVDCDWPEAAELAADFLWPTFVFGRLGKPASHWLYTAIGLKTEQYQFIDPSAPGDKKQAMVVELRSTGAQTVFPPSVHQDSGETVEWDGDQADAADGALVVEPELLRSRVAKLACGALMARYAGSKLAREWARGGAVPNLPFDVVEKIREWLGFGRPKISAPRPAQQSGSAASRASSYLARIPAAISGQGGHAQTLLAAEHLVRGFQLPDEVALALLEREYNPRCEPPWSTKELEHKVSEAREKGEAVSWGQHLGAQ